MLTKDFYNIVDNELNILLIKYKDDKLIEKHKSAINNQKSYALLIWFLEFYGRIFNYTNFITDGNNDGSCDIVFDKVNNQGNRVFYVVQSKWNNAANSEKETEKDEILKALSDFETILRGEKKKINEKLKIKLDELDLHLKANGEVKFIFLTLSQYEGGADENIASFRNNDVKTKFEVIDINRIRKDYIDRKYKKIDPINPLETYQNPEESPITIEIIQKGGTIKIEKPFEAYMFLLRPKAIWELFKRYGFELFYKNVRNPLLQSQFNRDIEKTALENPSYFWYYNNGITAITYFLPEIGKKAEKIQLTGLQIINGAQTVYCIYRAYEQASPTKRIQMDSEALVTLRLLKSGGKDFDLNVTRYTNSQNPVEDRDFCANDDIQLALQNESYQTNIWYEKRRDEFREIPNGITKVPNFVFADVYLAYHLQDPIGVRDNYWQLLETGKNMNFISHKDHKNGYYEKIFNNNTTYEDMLCAFYVSSIFGDTYDTVLRSHNRDYPFVRHYFLTFFKIIFTKYLKVKYGKKININKQIIKLYEKGEKESMVKTFHWLKQFLKISDESITEYTLTFLYSQSDYQKIYTQLEDLEISVKDIESIVL